MDTIERPKPFGRSLETLAILALRATGAEGYTLYEIDAATGTLRRGASYGNGAPDLEGLRPNGIQAAGRQTFPLHLGQRVIGILEFGISKNSLTPEKRKVLERTARLIQALLGVFRDVETQAQLAAQIGELEAGLADEKIAERAGGLLQTGDLDVDAMDALEDHVNKVLTARNLRSILDDLLRQLDQRMAERRLASRAKAVLQARQGYSEEQAYLYLRTASRRSRKRIGDIARQILDEDRSL